jgi:hypothetical protein
MTRFALFMVAALTASNLLAQKWQPNDEVRKAVEAYQKFQRDAHPPLYEQIQVTIPKASRLTIRHDHLSAIGFTVNLKNIGENNFTWSPDAIKIEVMDADGVAVPANHVRLGEYELLQDIPASYEIKNGHSAAKPITLAIEDDAVKIGTKYTIVASYVKLWQVPGVKYDSLSATKAVEVVADEPPPAEKKSP